MQIHELNGYTGTLNNAYMAVDDGTDTGKVKAKDITDPLNARIDNIIAGPAPSDAEIVDARLGADGVTYPSLGDAIRGQVSDLQSDINDISFFSKNVLPKAPKSSTVNNVDIDYADGVFTFDGTATGGGGRTTKLTDVFTLKAGTYTAKVSNVVADMYLQNSSGNTILATLNVLTAVTFTLSADTNVYLGVNTVNAREYNHTEQVQIEAGSTSTTFTPPSYATAIDKAVREHLDDINNINKIYQKTSNLMPVASKSSTVNDVTFDYADGGLYVHGTATGGGGRTTKLTSTFILPAGEYTAFIDLVVCDTFIQAVSGNTIIATLNTLTPVTFTLNADTEVYIGCSTVSAREYNLLEHIQIEKGDTATDFTKPSFITAIDTIARSSASEPNIIVPFIQTALDSGFKIYTRIRERYICYTFLRQIVNAINCDSWRIDAINAVDGELKNPIQLTTSGELECAIMLQGRSDYIGGRAHGDEVTTSIKFIIDGQVVDPANIVQAVNFNTLKVLSVSNLYDPDDSVTNVAEHGKEYTFNENGLKLTQYLNWKTAETIDQLYLSMLLGAKTATNNGYTNKTFTPFVLASNYGYYDDIDFIAEYSTTDPIFMSMSAEEYPCPAGHNKPQLRLTDNNSDYNKAYFVGYSGAVSVGERMDSVTKFEFKYN